MCTSLTSNVDEFPDNPPPRPSETSHLGIHVKRFLTLRLPLQGILIQVLTYFNRDIAEVTATLVKRLPLHLLPSPNSSRTPFATSSVSPPPSDRLASEILESREKTFDLILAGPTPYDAIFLI